MGAHNGPPYSSNKTYAQYQQDLMNAYKHYFSSANPTVTSTTLNQDFGFQTNKDDGKVDWAKFAMWLRGFLAGIEGKPLMPEDVGKIMDKLATVDPDRKLSYQPPPQNIPFAYPHYPQGSQPAPPFIPTSQWAPHTWKGYQNTQAQLSDELFNAIVDLELHKPQNANNINSINLDAPSTAAATTIVNAAA